MTDPTPPEDDYYSYYYGPQPDPASASKFAWSDGDAKVFSTPEEAQAWLDGENAEHGED